ncbi:CCR4-NOT transcription complex subunit 10 isoform X1 [Copidosoma floridanum]|uniref:CCR4-NOT transcription complex subunit 10 isoform X1 n=1 Tax=Copidosoma floridanum TaxID=29053 RepID=UPI0006C94A3C|nr:CCR4-NOT transcription complex subunit 10 isoform X1 [Copidosoma floridanum]
MNSAKNNNSIVKDEAPAASHEALSGITPEENEQERELAQRALHEYNKSNYEECSKILGQLERLRPHDLKVTHNKLIVDFEKSIDARRVEILTKSLQGISNSAKETEALEKSVLHYNQAVMMYHAGQYRAALEIANSLFSLIEPMDELFVHKICLLLIELHLALGKQDTALAVVHFAENHFTSAGAIDAVKSTLGEQSPNQKQEAALKTAAKVVTSFAAASPSAADKDQKKDNFDSAMDTDFKIKLLKCKLRVYLKTLQVKNYRNELKLNLVSRLLPMSLTSTILMRANHEFLRKNFKKAIKLLNSIDNKSVPDFKTSGECIPVLYYNNMASIHFALGKPNLASYYLKAAINENKKAVENLQNTDNIKPQPQLHALIKSKHYELMYSLGVSFLYSGQAAKAFDCFIEAAQQFHNESRLWLRMAECCIICHKPSNKADVDILEGRKNLVTKIIGEKNENCTVNRKFILNNTMSKTYTYGYEGLSFAIPQPTLEYGMLCLKNALFLLPKSKYEETNLPMTNFPAGEGIKKMAERHHPIFLETFSTAGNPKLANNISMMNPSSNQNSNTQTEPCQQTVVEHLNLKISILTASAYVSLCLGDYISALEYSKSLLSIKQLPGAQRLLGNLYAAESLICLDRIYEALEYLKPEKLLNASTYIPIQEISDDKEKVIEEIIEQKPTKVSWYPSDMASATAILQYNMSVAYAIRGELDKCTEVLKQIWNTRRPNSDIPIHVIMLAVYIELQQGNAETARNLIDRHYCSTLSL